VHRTEHEQQQPQSMIILIVQGCREAGTTARASAVLSCPCHARPNTMICGCQVAPQVPWFQWCQFAPHKPVYYHNRGFGLPQDCECQDLVYGFPPRSLPFAGQDSWMSGYPMRQWGVIFLELMRFGKTITVCVYRLYSRPSSAMYYHNCNKLVE
jgi:hypothetical protein